MFVKLFVTFRRTLKAVLLGDEDRLLERTAHVLVCVCVSGLPRDGMGRGGGRSYVA